MEKKIEYCGCKYSSGTTCGCCGEYICSDCGKLITKELAGCLWKGECVE